MKICRKCGHENEDDALYCVIDGSKLDDSVNDSQEEKKTKIVCKKCGFENSSKAKFCGGCGKAFEEDVRKKKVSFFTLKKVFLSLTIIFVALFCYSVFDDTGLFQGTPKEATYLYISDYSSMHFDAEGNLSESDKTNKIIVDTDGEWNVISPGWCKIEKSKNSFIVSCSPNIMKSESRECEIKIVAGKFEETIYVKQYYSKIK